MRDCDGGIPTSQASAGLAIKLGIPLTTFEQSGTIDVDVDGADEVDPNGNLIKGYGGCASANGSWPPMPALVVAVLVGCEKLVDRLGSRGKLPVEVVPFALPTCRRALANLRFEPKADVRRQVRQALLTGNPVLDCRIPQLDHPEAVDAAIRAIPGVVGTGLFLNMRPTVVVQHPDRIEVRDGSQQPREQKV